MNIQIYFIIIELHKFYTVCQTYKNIIKFYLVCLNNKLTINCVDLNRNLKYYY